MYNGFLLENLKTLNGPFGMTEVGRLSLFWEVTLLEID